MVLLFCPHDGDAVFQGNKTLQFEFTGSLEESGYIDITFNFAGLNYRDVRGMRIYELHGKSYRNVTLHVELHGKSYRNVTLTLCEGS